MSRELKRVPLDFDWPQKQIWWGYLLRVGCEYCKVVKTSNCPCCGGENGVYPDVPVPTGEGYQMWETTSEGSPISPVFKTEESLARWLSDTGASSFGSMTSTYEEWLRMILEDGWAPSMVYTPEGGLNSGVGGC